MRKHWHWIAAYIATIFAANFAISHFAPIPVGFGLRAPAGVLFAGLAFTLRDIVQERSGRIAVLAAIISGAALSAILSGALAIASGVAFLISELVDFGIYTPMRERSWLGAVAASNVVGLTLDSVIFLWLAFHSLAFLPGQIVGKVYMTALALVVLIPARRRFMPTPAAA